MNRLRFTDKCKEIHKNVSNSQINRLRFSNKCRVTHKKKMYELINKMRFAHKKNMSQTQIWLAFIYKPFSVQL